MFGNLLGMVLGAPHVLTQAYRDFWTLLKRGLRDELQFTIDYKGYVKPAHLLRSVQLACYTWFTHKRAQLQPPAPDFTSILRNISLQVYVLPHLPPALYQLAYPKTSKLPLTGPNPSIATGTVTTATQSIAGSRVSGLTATTRASGGKGAFQTNLTADSGLQQLLPATLRLKDLIGSDTPSLMDDGTAICLAFHLRNGCWSNCKRAVNHGKPLSATEKQRLANYVLEQVAKQMPQLPQTNPGGLPTPP